MTYESNDLLELKADMRELRAAIKAIEKKLRDEEHAKWLEECTNMTAGLVVTCVLWAFWFLMMIWALSSTAR